MRSTAPSKRDIVLIVPRHGGGATPSPEVLKKARLIAKNKGKKLLPPLNIPTSPPPAKEGEQTQSSNLEEELESSSDWNSLLLTARAQRGPQWDVASQQFMVDKGSDLYYNYTALMQVHKDKDEDTRQQQLQQQQDASQQKMLQSQHPQQPPLLDTGHSAQHQYNHNHHNPYQNPNSTVQLHQAPQQTPMMGMQAGMGTGSFGPGVYIPPDIRTNPRRATRAGGAGGQQGLYRV